MAVVVIVAVGDEEVGVDHLVQEGLDEVFTRSQLQKWDTQPEKVTQSGIKIQKPTGGGGAAEYPCFPNGPRFDSRAHRILMSIYS